MQLWRRAAAKRVKQFWQFFAWRSPRTSSTTSNRQQPILSLIWVPASRIRGGPTELWRKTTYHYIINFNASGRPNPSMDLAINRCGAPPWCVLSNVTLSSRPNPWEPGVAFESVSDCITHCRLLKDPSISRRLHCASLTSHCASTSWSNIVKTNTEVHQQLLNNIQLSFPVRLIAIELSLKTLKNAFNWSTWRGAAAKPLGEVP